MKKQFLLYGVIVSSFFNISINALVNPQPGENLWHIAAAIGTELDQLAVSSSQCCAGTFTTIEGLQNTLSSKIDLCCFTLNSKIDALTGDIVSDFSGTFTVLQLIDNDVLTASSKIDLCCATLNSKIDSLAGIVVTDFAGTFTSIAAIQCSGGGGSSPCAPTPLSQSSSLIINASGNYCLSQDITGNISITASDVTIDLNNRSLFGTIDVATGLTNINIQNGYVAPNSDITDATHAAIKINSGADIKINQCFILCAMNNFGVNGRGGIDNAASNVIIEDCLIQAGVGGSSLSTAGSGGIGINNTGNFVKITESTIRGGNGGKGADGAAPPSNSGQNGNPGGNAGSGGIGINNFGSNVCIIDCKIQSGFGNSGGNGSSGADNINNAGNGASAGSGGNGGQAVYTNNANVLIIENQIVAGIGGAGGKGGNGGFAAIGGAGGNAGNGGAGGIGIFLDTNSSSAQIIRSKILAANGGLAGDGGDSEPNSSVNGTAGIGGNGGDGGKAILNKGLNTQILKSTAIAGRAGDGGFGGAAPGSDSFANKGGNGGLGGDSINIDSINIAADQSLIFECSIQGKNGGNGGRGGAGESNPAGDGGNGGNGGAGIFCVNGNLIKIRNCSIDQSGAGGTFGPAGIDEGGGPGNNGSAGNALDGINISATCNNTEINDCSISNCAAFAINDLAGSSTIYGNFAYDNTSFPAYSLGASAAVDATGGTAFAPGAGTSKLQNIRKP